MTGTVTARENEMYLGESIDRLVEEHIFGRDDAYYHCPHFDAKGRMLSFCGCPDRPQRSTRMQDAWPVVTKLVTEGGYAFRLDLEYGNPTRAEVLFWNPRQGGAGKSPEPSEAHGPLALAICLAALRAVSAEDQIDMGIPMVDLE
jgi:hypothetical protein